MRIPEFVVVNLSHSVPQGPYLTMNLAGAKFKPQDGTLENEFDLLIALAQRIDSMVEENNYERSPTDRDILSSEKMIPLIQAARTSLETRFQRKEIDASQFDDEASFQKDYDDLLQFLDASEYAFEKIHAEQLVHDLWRSFLAGEDPELEDYDYSFQIKASLPLTCSFCGKDQKQVEKIIAGPNCYICNECVNLCNDIIASDGEAPSEKERGEREE